MNILKIVPLMLAVSYSHQSLAVWGDRTAPVVSVQSESATRVGYEGIVWIRQDAPWSGSPACNGTWGYFNSKVNPHFTATALAARLSSQPLRVYVDDALPKIDGICQIFNVQL